MLRLASVAATLCLFAVSAKSQVPKAKDLWFAPSPDWENIYPGKSADYQKLFANPNEWPITYQAAKVLVLNVHFASQGPSGELTKVIDFVDKSRMVLAATFPGILRGPNDCGRGLESFYGTAGVPRLEAERLASLGAKPGYAVIDSALYFGHLYTGTNACRFTVEQVAQRVATTIKDIQAVFPSVKFRENEPTRTLAAAPKDVLAYYRALASHGVLLDGVFLGVTGGRSSPAEGQTVINVLNQVGIPYSLILLGSGQDTSDVAWARDAQQKALAWGAAGLNTQPTSMQIASWQPFPKHILPESTFGSFTSLAAWYVRQAGITPVRGLNP